MHTMTALSYWWCSFKSFHPPGSSAIQRQGTEWDTGGYWGGRSQSGSPVFIIQGRTKNEVDFPCFTVGFVSKKIPEGLWSVPSWTLRSHSVLMGYVSKLKHIQKWMNISQIKTTEMSICHWFVLPILPTDLLSFGQNEFRHILLCILETIGTYSPFFIFSWFFGT